MTSAVTSAETEARRLRGRADEHRRRADEAELRPGRHEIVEAARRHREARLSGPVAPGSKHAQVAMIAVVSAGAFVNGRKAWREVSSHDRYLHQAAQNPQSLRHDVGAFARCAPSNDGTQPSLVSHRRKIAMSKPDADRLIVKSRHRVKTYGEVFTPRSMVDQMLDLVSDHLELGEAFVDKTFLEPAAGDGNFLVAILQRKLAAIKASWDQSAWQRESLFALASVYAIELLEDNHRDAQAALLRNFVEFHTSSGNPCSPRTDLYRAAAFLVRTNILRGNTLTGRAPDGDEMEFSWWIRQADDPSMVKREPFTFNSLREDGAFDFTVYATYKPCPVRHVHKKATAHA
ncbi:hypothetical protein J2X60_001115 [Curtobacterium sp. 320]|uniref:hypothetical protein n=1 Tax=Curtobacterium sp. 320 TaxID=2817749 RepID=UPI002857090F|nr:hypothetical protein [Curtobacterium sp. 320]MDR6572475.1 hypothetical protein [Curtobacterium sp. 320]